MKTTKPTTIPITVSTFVFYLGFVQHSGFQQLSVKNNSLIGDISILELAQMTLTDESKTDACFGFKLELNFSFSEFNCNVSDSKIDDDFGSR